MTMKNLRSKSTITIRINGQLIDEKKDKIIRFPLFFKEDGKRFKMEQTLKMLVSFSYQFEIFLERQVSQIRYVKMDIGVGSNARTTFMELIDYHKCEPDRSRISFVWDSNMAKMIPDKRNHRDLLKITLIFYDMTMIDIPIQVKFYKKICQHFRWGDEFDYCRATFYQNNNKNNKNDSSIITKLYAKPKYFQSKYKNPH